VFCLVSAKRRDHYEKEGKPLYLTGRGVGPEEKKDR